MAIKQSFLPTIREKKKKKSQLFISFGLIFEQLSCFKNSMPANLEISAVATGLEKVSFYSKAMPKNAQTTTQ